MGAPIGKTLEITGITSKGLVANGANNSWQFMFISNAPFGWESGDQIRISAAPKLTASVTPGLAKSGDSARVLVENLTKKSAGISMLFDGAEYKEKAFSQSGELLLSLQKNIRMDRELMIIKKFPGDVIQVTNGTKWQLSRVSELGHRIEWDEDDAVVITKSTAPSSKIVKIINKSKSHELSATYISED